MQEGDSQKMKNLLFNNTYKSGHIHSFIFKGSADDFFTGVALEFDVVIQAKTAEKAEECLLDTVENYLRNVVDNELSEQLLNTPADKKYWELYKQAIKTESKFIELVLENKKPISPLEKIPFNITRSDYRDGNFSFA